MQMDKLWAAMFRLTRQPFTTGSSSGKVNTHSTLLHMFQLQLLEIGMTLPVSTVEVADDLGMWELRYALTMLELGLSSRGR